VRLQLPVPCFCRAPMAKNLPAYIHRPKKARISATSFILSWLDRVSICTKQAVHPSIRCCLSRCLASTYACMLPTQAPCMHIYIYIYMENFSYFYIHTHEQSIHALWQKQPAMAAADLLLPCLANLLCFAFRPLTSYCNICKRCK